MVKNNLKNVITRNIAGKIAALSMAAMIAVGGIFSMQQSAGDVPELTVFVDHHEEKVVIDDGSVPLGGETKVDVKTTKKVVKMKKASKKTYTKKKTSKKNSTKKQSNGTTTKIQITTLVTQKFKKGSKKKTIITKVTTKTTVTSSSKQVQTASVTPSSDTAITGAVSISTIAPKVDSRVSQAFQDLGFTITVDPTVSYSGYFNAKNRSITLKRASDVVYHELGHFLAFIAGNVDTKPEFKSVFEAEKNKYTASNKAYVTQNSSEYFAESFRNYTLDPAGLKQSRPKTFAAIENALSKVTQEQVTMIKTAYAPIWGE